MTGDQYVPETEMARERRCVAGQAWYPDHCEWHSGHFWCPTCGGFYGVSHDGTHGRDSRHGRDLFLAQQCACRPCKQLTATRSLPDGELNAAALAAAVQAVAAHPSTTLMAPIEDLARAALTAAAGALAGLPLDTNPGDPAGRLCRALADARADTVGLIGMVEAVRDRARQRDEELLAMRDRRPADDRAARRMFERAAGEVREVADALDAALKATGTGMTVESATELARRHHAGQFDKSGRPYVEHVIAVRDMLVPYGPDAQMAGVLHDIVEDTDATLDDLAAAGAPPNVVEAVDAVTRRAGETYAEFIARAAAHPLGRIVKLADNRHNTLPDRLAALPPDTAAGLQERYRKARRTLAQAFLDDADEHALTVRPYYPTADAYARADAAVWKHRARADAAVPLLREHGIAIPPECEDVPTDPEELP